MSEEENDLEEILKESLHLIVKALDADAGSYFIQDEGSHEIVLFASCRGKSEIQLLRFPFDASTIVGKVLTDRKPHLSANSQKDPFHNKEAEKKTGYSIRNMIAIPFQLDLGEKKENLVLEVMNRNNYKTLDGSDRQTIVIELTGILDAIANKDKGLLARKAFLQQLDKTKEEFLDDIIRECNRILKNRPSGMIQPKDAEELKIIFKPIFERYKLQPFFEKIMHLIDKILSSKFNRTFSQDDIDLCNHLLDRFIKDIRDAYFRKASQERERRLHALAESFNQVGEWESLNDLCERILEGALNICDANAAFLWFYGQNDIKMKIRESFMEYLKDEYPEEDDYKKIILSLTNEIRNVSEEIVAGEKPLVVRDLYQGSQTDTFLESLVSTTMKIHGNTISVLSVVNTKNEKMLDDDDFEYLNTLATFVRSQLMRAIADEKLKKIRSEDEIFFSDFSFEQSGIAMIGLNEKNRIVKVNRAWEGLCGKSKNEFINETVMEIIPKVKKLGLSDSLRTLIDSRSPRQFLYDIEGHQRDGRPAVYFLGQNLITGKNEDYFGKVIYIIDVSDEYWK